jgi:hypothetical protein
MSCWKTILRGRAQVELSDRLVNPIMPRDAHSPSPQIPTLGVQLITIDFFILKLDYFILDIKEWLAAHIQRTTQQELLVPPQQDEIQDGGELSGDEQDDSQVGRLPTWIDPTRRTATTR